MVSPDFAGENFSEANGFWNILTIGGNPEEGFASLDRGVEAEISVVTFPDEEGLSKFKEIDLLATYGWIFVLSLSLYLASM